MKERTMTENLINKLDILEKIRRNTELQGRFVRRRDMVGLKRLLRARAALIDDLATVNLELDGGQWSQPADLAGVIAQIESKQKEILSLNDEVLRGAMAERNRMAAELNDSRTFRRLKSRYAKQWTQSSGRTLNLKG